MEQRLLKKAKDVKHFTEINMTSHDKYLEKNMENVLLKVEKNIQIIAGQLIDNSELYAMIYKKYVIEYINMKII